MAVTIVRTSTSSQLNSLLTQASASTTYLTQTSASTIYATKASPTFTGTATMTYPTINSNTNRNTKMGTSSLASISGGVENVGIGYQSLFSNTSGNYNVGIGSSALLGIQTGSNNIGIGFSSLGNATGSSNIGIGQYAGVSMGSGSYNVIIGSNYGSTISNLSNNVIISDGQGNIRIQANSSGIVTKPSQPYFHVRSTQATAVGGDVLWSVIDNNIGSYYTAANGRFTAPVAGTYFFSAHGLWNNADAGDMRIALYKNAAGINGNRFILTKTASNWMTFYLNDIIYLAANDYVTVRYVQGTNTLHVDADYNGFRGWLLG
jgi:hypothetical protein